jgi:HNH endonuclease
MDRLEKDAWILRALAKGALRVREDGKIFRPGKFGLDEVKFHTHKKTGRVYFNLRFEGVSKSVLVNRVVGLALIPNPLAKPEVNHRDGNKANNHPRNLEWSTRVEQEIHASRTGLKANRGSSNANAKLRPEQVAEIRALTKEQLVRYAADHGLAPKTILDAWVGRTWSHLPGAHK